ncbi:hypothetical protein ACLOJK_025334 [Asimina triloba]
MHLERVALNVWMQPYSVHTFSDYTNPWIPPPVSVRSSSSERGFQYRYDIPAGENSNCAVTVSYRTFVGAGIEGISAAKVLAEKGVKDVVILEASDRIGGRIRMEEFGGEKVETGAAWIQGVGGNESNPIWDLASKHRLRTCYSDYTSLKHNIYDKSGKIVPTTLAADSYDRAVEAAARALKNQDATSAESPQRVPSTPIELAIDFTLHDVEMSDVEPIATFVDMGKGEFLVADGRGYEFLLYKLAECFLLTKDGNIIDTRLKLNKVVREVHHSRKGATLVTEDGCVFNARFVILSVSIGVLQSGTLLRFFPPLPVNWCYVLMSKESDDDMQKWKREAISTVDVTVYTKIFLKFPYKFWPCVPGTEFFLYAHEKRGYYTFWQRVEVQSEEETMEEAMRVVRDMFGPDVPDAIQILVPRWWSNRFHQGSYSNYPIFATHYDFRHIKVLSLSLPAIGSTWKYIIFGYWVHLERRIMSRACMISLGAYTCITINHDYPRHMHYNEPLIMKRGVGGWDGPQGPGRI